jgi:glycosyltransferase involved in cell wall biosynthesis
MPSTTETQGLVMAEALAAGCSIIAADAPQNRDVLGPAATIVPAEAAAFARAFRAVPERPDAAAAERARAAAERFAIDAQVERMLALYESLTTNIRSL